MAAAAAAACSGGVRRRCSRRRRARGLLRMTAGDVASATVGRQQSVLVRTSMPHGAFASTTPPAACGVGGAVELRTSTGSATKDCIQKQGRRPFSRGGPPRVNAFTNLVEHTVDAMRDSGGGQSYEELRRLLAEIRKQYDDVHCQAERVENEVAETRREIWAMELEADVPPEALSYSNLTREDLIKHDAAVCQEIFAAKEQKKVYHHMVERMRRELKIVQQKIKMMEGHLNRKAGEVAKKQEYSRRVLRENVQSLHSLENMEQDIELERMVCSAALDDLDMTLQERKSQVRHREEFERWRYEVAMEAATEAFHASAGRLRRLFAIEKLTGSCLQKVIFEQAVQSQATEDGFQRIREVTGLNDVMDIVHKFLNRDVEHEQLRAAVREAEVRLHALREADVAQQNEHTSPGLDVKLAVPLGLSLEVAQQEHGLSRALRDEEDVRRALRDDVLLITSVTNWTERMRESLVGFESLEPVNCSKDLIRYFTDFAQVVDRFMSRAGVDLPVAKLFKLTSQATSKEYAEQSKLLNDRDFVRANCRVPASLDSKHMASGKLKYDRQQMGVEWEQDVEVHLERERLKLESRSRAGERDARHGPQEARRESSHGRRESQQEGGAGGGGGNGSSHGAHAQARHQHGGPRPGTGGGATLVAAGMGGSVVGAAAAATPASAAAAAAARQRPSSSRASSAARRGSTGRVASSRPTSGGGAAVGSGAAAARAAAAARTPR